MNEVPLTPPLPPPSSAWGSPPSSSTPPSKPGWSTKKKWVVAGLVTFIVLAIIGAATDEGDGDAEKSAPPVTAAAIVDNESDTPVTVNDAPVTDATVGNDVAEWAVETQAAMTEGGDTLSEISRLATGGDIAGTIDACENAPSSFSKWPSLIADAPTSELRETMASAYSHYSSAFTSCASGDFESAIVELNAGTEYINDATTLVLALTP